ncbi:MAG: hypothetical protein IJQ97_03060 [Paludibacteraceae bacterium]|nr:hypothetical protein [Paludibacteraceae bacterium]
MRYSHLYTLAFGFAVVVCLSGCNLLHRDAKQGAVAQLGNYYLYQADLNAVTRHAATPEDSARYAEQFIRRWATDILQYQEGKNHSTPELEALVEDYRRSLYVAEYEQHLVDKRMPKTVSDAEADTFYVHHPERFILQENILQGALLVIPNDAPAQAELCKRLNDLTDEENLEYIEKYAYQYASGYELFTNQWRTGNQILMRMPTNDWQKTLAAGKQYAEQDTASVYLLQVTDCRLAGEAMPVDYARQSIEKMILAERRVSFLQKQRLQLYEDAVRFGKLKITNNQTTH